MHTHHTVPRMLHVYTADCNSAMHIRKNRSWANAYNVYVYTGSSAYLYIAGSTYYVCICYCVVLLCPSRYGGWRYRSDGHNSKCGGRPWPPSNSVGRTLMRLDYSVQAQSLFCHDVRWEHLLLSLSCEKNESTSSCKHAHKTVSCASKYSLQQINA